MPIQIDPEFLALIPPLSADEKQQLEANIVEDGCRDPLVVWGEILIDGHNRYEICTRLGLPFETVVKEFDSRVHARIWMRQLQRGRRNLSDGWLIELALGDKADLLLIGAAIRKETEGRPSKESVVTNDSRLPKHDTR